MGLVHGCTNIKWVSLHRPTILSPTHSSSTCILLQHTLPNPPLDPFDKPSISIPPRPQPPAADHTPPNHTPQYSPNPDSTTTLINPIHPPEICPPSTSRWQKLKDENEQRKSREVVRMGSEEVERITGRDSRGFRKGEWTEAEKEQERKTQACLDIIAHRAESNGSGT